VFKLAVIGSRSYHDYKELDYVINQMFNRKRLDKPEIKLCIVSGGARGADTLAKQYANSRDDVEYREFKADWMTHGKKAGIIRNYDIVRECDVVLAFWNGKSKGTKHTLQLATQFRKPIRVVRF
jgi:hypothetical protein